MNDDFVLVHVAFAPAQLCVFRPHSSVSVQVMPEPVKPVLQVHVNDEAVSAHNAVEAQVCVPR